MPLMRDDVQDQNAARQEQNAQLNAQLQQQNQQPHDVQIAQPAIHRVAVKLPPFWTDKPSLWFAQADSQFVISDIVNEKTKFHYVVSQLDTRIAAEVEDIITNPPEANQYTYLKTKLIERLSVSEEQRVRQLINEEELGDRKHSQFLRYLRSLSGTTPMQDNLLRHLWLRRLPPNAQAILTAQSEMSLEKLSELADKIIEVLPTVNFSVNAASVNQGKEDNLLLNAIEALTAQVSALSAARSRSRSRTRQDVKKDESSNQSDSNRLCWYHAKFQDKARKCIQPCNFQGNFHSSQ